MNLKFIQVGIRLSSGNVCPLISCLFKHYHNTSETVFYLNHGFSPPYVFIHVASWGVSDKYFLTCIKIHQNFVFFITKATFW